MRIVRLLVSSITVASARCGVGLIQGLASCDCYKFVSVADSWYSAEWQCGKLGGYLASVGNAFTSSFLKSKVPSRFAVDYWLGGSNDDRTSIWKWLDGTPFEYKNWDARQPVIGSPLCLASSTTSGKWSGQACHQPKPYVCRLHATYDGCPTPIPTRAAPPALPVCPAGLPTTAACTCADTQCVKRQICDATGTGVCSPPICPANEGAPAGGCICGDSGVMCGQYNTCAPVNGTCTAPAPPACTDGVETDKTCVCGGAICKVGQYCHTTVNPKCLDVCQSVTL